MKIIKFFRDCLLIAWILSSFALYILVTVPPESRIASFLPSFFWHLREIIYPYFFSPSLYSV